MSPSSFDEDGAAILARRQYFIALALGGLAGCTSRVVGSEGGAGPASRARCQPSEPSERPRRNKGSRRPASSESNEPEAARTQAKAAPKFGEGGGARGLVREPKDDAGDGVAIGGAGSG